MFVDLQVFEYSQCVLSLCVKLVFALIGEV